MLKEPVARISWSGRRAIEESMARLREGTDIVLELPLAVHHALVARLRPGAAARESEPLVVDDGPEILEAVAGIAGLEDLARLRKCLKRQDWRVTVASPHPRLVIRRR